MSNEYAALPFLGTFFLAASESVVVRGSATFHVVNWATVSGSWSDKSKAMFKLAALGPNWRSSM